MANGEHAEKPAFNFLAPEGRTITTEGTLKGEAGCWL